MRNYRNTIIFRSVALGRLLMPTHTWAALTGEFTGAKGLKLGGDMVKGPGRSWREGYNQNPSCTCIKFSKEKWNMFKKKILSVWSWKHTWEAEAGGSWVRSSRSSSVIYLQGDIRPWLKKQSAERNSIQFLEYYTHFIHFNHDWIVCNLLLVSLWDWRWAKVWESKEIWDWLSALHLVLLTRLCWDSPHGCHLACKCAVSPHGCPICSHLACKCADHIAQPARLLHGSSEMFAKVSVKYIAHNTHSEFGEDKSSYFD